MLNSAHLQNFGPIENLNWQNLGKINLIIGENSCGKSFILKALYSAMRTIEEYKRGDNPDTVPEIVKRKLYWTFQAEKITDLIGQNDSPLSVTLNFNDEKFIYTLNQEAVISSNSIQPRSDNSIFLPAKEVLSLHNLIITSRERDQLFGFDDTYLDLVTALQGQRKLSKDLKDAESLIYSLQLALKQIDDVNKTYPIPDFDSAELQQRQQELDLAGEFLKQEISKNIFTSVKLPPLDNTYFKQCIKKLATIIDGRIEYNNETNRWYFVKGDKNFPMGVTAEGIKKIGILETLLSNGFLNENSLIFIDELEANLHPTAITQLLDIIAILAEYGMQVFIASHSYFVVKKLFLIAQEHKMSIPVLSYQNGDWVQSDLKDDLPDNPIIDESIRLYEQQLDMD